MGRQEYVDLRWTGFSHRVEGDFRTEDLLKDLFHGRVGDPIGPSRQVSSWSRRDRHRVTVSDVC